MTAVVLHHVREVEYLPDKLKGFPTLTPFELTLNVI